MTDTKQESTLGGERVDLGGRQGGVGNTNGSRK